MAKRKVNQMQLINKPIEDMTPEELSMEAAVHKYAARRMYEGARCLRKRLHWLRENKPFYTDEEIEDMWERGEMSDCDHMTAKARNNKLKKSHRDTEIREIYAVQVADYENALLARIEERQIQLKAKHTECKRGRKPRGTPRKNASKYNIKTWLPMQDLMPAKKILRVETKWNPVDDSNSKLELSMRRAGGSRNWNLERLKFIARDRGFFSDQVLYAAVAQELLITVTGAEELLKSGKLSWGQIILIGAMFEMTPGEFCDVFLNGYFVEVVDGKYVATIEDEEKPVLREFLPKRRYVAESKDGNNSAEV